MIYDSKLIWNQHCTFNQRVVDCIHCFFMLKSYWFEPRSRIIIQCWFTYMTNRSFYKSMLFYFIIGRIYQYTTLPSFRGIPGIKKLQHICNYNSGSHILYYRMDIQVWFCWCFLCFKLFNVRVIEVDEFVIAPYSIFVTIITSCVFAVENRPNTEFSRESQSFNQ